MRKSFRVGAGWVVRAVLAFGIAAGVCGCFMGPDGEDPAYGVESQEGLEPAGSPATTGDDRTPGTPGVAPAGVGELPAGQSAPATGSAASPGAAGPDGQARAPLQTCGSRGGAPSAVPCRNIGHGQPIPLTEPASSGSTGGRDDRTE